MLNTLCVFISTLASKTREPTWVESCQALPVSIILWWSCLAFKHASLLQCSIRITKSFVVQGRTCWDQYPAFQDPVGHEWATLICNNPIDKKKNRLEKESFLGCIKTCSSIINLKPLDYRKLDISEQCLSVKVQYQVVPVIILLMCDYLTFLTC